MAVRYNQKTKDEVVKFIQDYNSKNGRGGQSAAAKKYKITPITISSWLKKAGVKTGGKKRRATRKAGRKPRAAASAGGSKSKVLNRMVKIQSQIEALQSEYDALLKQL